MARLALNKASLSRESARLKNFERFLPSLELKRQQLLAQRSIAAAQLAKAEGELTALRDRVRDSIPMASTEEVDLQGLVRVLGVVLDEENVVGVKLPLLTGVEVEIRRYGLLGRPAWVDNVSSMLRQVLQLEVEVQVKRRRLDILHAAARKITQRVNLFDKVLMPRARENIRTIRISLSDAERAGVVRAKIAKKKSLEARL